MTFPAPWFRTFSNHSPLCAKTRADAPGTILLTLRCRGPIPNRLSAGLVRIGDLGAIRVIGGTGILPMPHRSERSDHQFHPEAPDLES